MFLRDYYASDIAKEHMWQDHRVEWEEVREVLDEQPSLRRARTERDEPRYWADGTTVGGRALRVVVALESDGRARVITAFPPRTRKQKRRFRGRRR